MSARPSRLRSAWSVLVVGPSWLWLGLGIPVSLTWFCINYRPFNTSFEARVESAGGVLQICGTLVVVIGLLDKRSILGEEEWVLIFARWLGRLEALFVGTRTENLKARVSGGGSFRISASVAALSVQRRDTEARIQQLEADLRALQATVASNAEELRRQVEDVRQDIHIRSRDTSERLNNLQSKVRHLSVGSATQEVVGLFWIIFGQLLGTWPALARFLA